MNTQWPVYWSAIVVGVLTALAVGLLVGLMGFAFGAHQTADFVDWHNIGLISLVFSIAGAFFAFVAGGWVAAKIAGFSRSEAAILHGVIVWLLALPLLVAFGAGGVLGDFGGWYGGLASLPASMVTGATPSPDLAIALRNNALATAAALLIGLLGAVIGGWMASGEPMTFTYYRTNRLEKDQLMALILLWLLGVPVGLLLLLFLIGVGR